MKLTKHEAYVAMFYFLHDYWERHGRPEGDVLEILRDMQICLSNRMPVDLAHWLDWQRAINKVQRKNPLTDHYLKLTKENNRILTTSTSKLKVWRAVGRLLISLIAVIIIFYIQFLGIKHDFT